MEHNIEHNIELEIRLHRHYSFTVESIDYVMNYPRENLKQVYDKFSSIISITGPIWSEPQTTIDTLESLSTPYEPTGQASVIIDFNKQTIVVHPDASSYVHFPLYRYIADWKDYIT